MLNEFLFTIIEEEDIGNIWFQQDDATCHTAEAILDVLRPVFENRIIRPRADGVWPPRSCDLTPLDYYLWGADKPETIDALKDNIREAIGEIQLQTIDNVPSKISVMPTSQYNTREAIGEIQLHTIDNVLKNWSDRKGYNRTALGATQPKLHLMFGALFLKIALSVAELMSFGHLGAAIWHRWTIICGLPERQARANWSFKGQYSWSYWWNTAAHNR